MADFVNNNLRDPFSPGDFADNTGLVGMVVGASGRLKEVQLGYDSTNNPDFRSNPAFRGINGDAINIEARNIMAMVAGSVVQIASIQNIANIVVTAAGDIGVVKDHPPGAPPGKETWGYLDKDNNLVPEPVLDGKLIDGAVVYKNGTPPPGLVFRIGG